MFTTTPKLSPIQQQLNQQIQNSHNKTQCYLQMYNSQQTKIPTINLIHHLDKQKLLPIVEQIFKNQSPVNETQNITLPMLYCAKVYINKTQTQKNNKTIRNSFLKFIGFSLLILMFLWQIPVFVYKLITQIWQSMYLNTCQPVDYLLWDSDYNMNNNDSNRINWQKICCLNYFIVIIIIVIYIKNINIYYSCADQHFRAFVSSRKRVKQLKQQIVDLVDRQRRNQRL